MSNTLKSSKSAPATRMYRQASAEQRMFEREQRLLAAALELFSRDGYAQTTIEALCSEAKVTTRHFYQAFATRDALLLKLYNQLIADLQQGLLLAIMGEDLSLQDRIKRLIQALIQHYLTDKRCAQIGVIEVVGASPMIERRRREVIHGIARMIETFMLHLAALGRIPEHNYRMLALAIVGGVNELIADWLVSQQPSLEELEAEMIYAINTLILGAEHRLNTSV